ncbi:penicillin acylase family protein [Flavitalea sp. BT771]|uniref:penicillin acylase family protein n=1 Tax=Flavitalea sp. BT771 TaxID=3063329 RepID=UPI0026E1B031|nr:penicillin acylase family protein [Flavitalea sp. BT771]MDO6430105.1 penicillin acylase family protein [Flavitalea sp. BT771]MDV6219756.1 penicillin acylase family protein [Flavitalea sp. BT771]
MRIIPFLLSLLLTTALIFFLDNQWGKLPPLGKFLSPQHGFWQNAEDVDKSFTGDLALPGLKDRASVYFDQYLVPHVYANSESDACYIQGYLHAKFRLWQMEFQTFAAAGRLSEVLGSGENDNILKYDRSMRRLGMVEAAKKAVEEMEKDSTTKKDCDAYTAGVNDYISNMKAGELPLEYKLLNYRPEPWSNLKIALFVKYMAFDLASRDNDFEMTNAKSIFSKEDLAKLYPAVIDSADPIIPKGTHFLPPLKLPRPPATADSLYFNNKDTVTAMEMKPEKSNGSNNWAVSGKKTLSGSPILCNDPHLSTNLPAIWYQMQIRTPNYNVYGVSFPGAPYIVIGFNDSCAWGVTNAGRDVRDYYRIKFKDDKRREYWFDSAWRTVESRVDTIRIKGMPDFYDTVVSTVFGPVMYDPTFNGFANTAPTGSYAVHWQADIPSNELATFGRLQGAANYDDYKNALAHFKCPGQNFVFAAKNGQVAIWQQGEFPGKWKGQGLYVMPGEDSSYMWKDTIPADRNPNMIDPDRGFVSSANQVPVDTSYPYFLGSDFPPYRGLLINRMLNQMSSITPADMMKLQTENYDVFAEMAKPLLLRNIQESQLDETGKGYLNQFKLWKLRNDPDEQGPVIFKCWWDHLQKEIYDDEFAKYTLPLMRPFESALLEALLKDSTYPFIDNINTAEKETLQQVVTAAFLKSVPDLVAVGQHNKATWSKFKDTWARHLLRLPALSRTHLNIGGGTHCINAAKQFHGPSWRMIVQLTNKTEAYGVYPGGQSGNPGSPYYDTFIDSWASGKYYPLWVMDMSEIRDKRIKWTLHLKPGNQ